MSTTNGLIGTVHPIDITSTMQEAYLDYAMSVIVARALPDVRDGLKPVHRRILYAMYHDLNLVFNRPHKKSARIVGEVLGKYHPHGDTAVYDAMVRMAQDFSLRYPLVDGQGNFGSIDGDNAAAMRYTEARLAEISDLMLTDLEKDTVEWHDNFDNSLREPDVLPAALPNLLINGASGIAVGMATNIPPHNLDEIVDALTFMIDRYDHLEDVTVEDLLDFIKGPDFPTGGILYRFRQEKNGEEIDVVTQGYSVGKARMILQAKAHFEEMSRNRSRIVVTELPYQTNKTALIERIAGLVRDGKIEGITDLRDESDRTGMRIVIELTRNVEPKAILAHLFKYTPLQQTFGMQMLALVDGQPRLLGLKRMLHLFVQHREEIIRRRSEYDLKRARDRAHILEGLLKALDILDEVIATIRRSQRVDTARTNLMRDFGFTQIQAQAILDMQLRRLAALERKRLQDEYKELLEFIGYLEDLLAHPEKVLTLIKKDLIAIKEKYGNPRRTQIVDRTKGTLTSTDLLPEQDVWVSVMGNGELKRSDVGKLTRSSAQTRAKISQVALLPANTLDYLYLFAADGRSARVAIHETPRDRRKHLSEFTDFTRRDEITAAISIPRVEADGAKGYLFFATEQGIVKRVAMADFLAAAPSEPKVMNIDSNDRLAFVFATQGDQEVILVSEGGKSIRFSEEDVRSMGLAAGGVGGMKLRKGERVVYVGVVDGDGELMTATEKGFVKRSALTDYSRQGRNGGGIVTHKLSGRTGKVAAATVLTKEDLAKTDNWIAVVTVKGQAVMLTVGETPQMGRGVLGKQLVQVGGSDHPCALRVVTEWRGDSSETGDDPAAEAENVAPSEGKPKADSSRSNKSKAKKTVAAGTAAAGTKRVTSSRAKAETKAPQQATLDLADPEAGGKASTPGRKRAAKPAKPSDTKPASTKRSTRSSGSERTSSKPSTSSRRATKTKKTKAATEPAATKPRPGGASTSTGKRASSSKRTSRTTKKETAQSSPKKGTRKPNTTPKGGRTTVTKESKPSTGGTKKGGAPGSKPAAKSTPKTTGRNKSSTADASKGSATSSKPATKRQPKTTGPGESRAASTESAAKDSKKKPASGQTSRTKKRSTKATAKEATPAKTKSSQPAPKAKSGGAASSKKSQKLKTVTTVNKKQSGAGKKK